MIRDRATFVIWAFHRFALSPSLFHLSSSSSREIWAVFRGVGFTGSKALRNITKINFNFSFKKNCVWISKKWKSINVEHICFTKNDISAYCSAREPLLLSMLVKCPPLEFGSRLNRISAIWFSVWVRDNDLISRYFEYFVPN